jgi:hypothetical protein
MDGMLQSANYLFGSLLSGAGGYFDWVTSALREDPTVSVVVFAILLGAWLFHRRNPSAP